MSYKNSKMKSKSLAYARLESGDGYGYCRNRKKWWRGTESNRRHMDFQSTALPTELPRHFFWWKRQGSNLWPLACKASALPLSYASTPGALKGIRTPAAGLKGQCPRPLDDEGAKHRLISYTINLIRSRA